MSVARRRLDVAVAKQLADHWQRLAERQCAGREGVTEIMFTGVRDARDVGASQLRVGRMKVEIVSRVVRQRGVAQAFVSPPRLREKRTCCPNSNSNSL